MPAHVSTMYCQFACSQPTARHRGQFSSFVYVDCAQLPQEWKVNHFQRVTLHELGLRFQLGHVSSDYCSAPVPGHVGFVVVALNGVHTVNVTFCGCPGAPDQYVQLLESRWWPSTPLAPQTAVMMDALRSFHIWNLQGRISPTDFYRGLEKMTDGQGLVKLPVSMMVDQHYM